MISSFNSFWRIFFIFVAQGITWDILNKGEILKPVLYRERRLYATYTSERLKCL